MSYLIDVVDPNGEPRRPSAGNGNGLVILSSELVKNEVHVNEYLIKHTNMDTLERNDFFFALQVDGIAEYIHGPDNTHGFDITVMKVDDPKPQESLQDKCVRMAREAAK